MARQAHAPAVNFEDVYASCATDSYFGPVEPSFFHALLAARVASRPGQVALDLGCGDGRHARALAEAGWSIVGVDAVGEGLRKAKMAIGEAFEPIELPITLASVNELSKSRPQDRILAAFDLVIAITFLDHLEPGLAKPVINQAGDLLRPGGAFIASVMTTWDPAAPICYRPAGFTPYFEGTSDTTSEVKHYFDEGELLSYFKGWLIAYLAQSFEAALHPPDHSHGFETICAIKPPA